MPDPMGMSRPPVPPEVAAQQAPFTGVGGMMGQQQAAGHPLVQAIDAVSKVLDQAAKTSPKFAPYAQRAMAILKSGVEEAMGGKPGGAETTPSGPPSAPPPGQMPA